MCSRLSAVEYVPGDWAQFKMANEKELIEQYFQSGYENKVIVDILRSQHGIFMSLSTLKRRLQDYGLKRRGVDIDENRLRELIQNEISGPGQLRGYRAVWHLLRLCHKERCGKNYKRTRP